MILNDILDISKIEAGKLVLQSVSFDLHQVARDVVALNRGEAAAKGLGMTLEIAPTVPATVIGDPARMRQILQNLVGNAVKFTDAGDVVLRIAVKELRGDRLLVLVEVRDTGIGIGGEQRDQLFRPFSQLDPSPSRRFGGTGLGLAISRRLVEMMGGEIGVDSRPGQGSRFWFTLDLEMSSAPQPAEATIPAPGEMRPLRILLAEDNRINQMLVSAMLTKFGHSVEVAENGRAALAALTARPFDVVLMDMQMPEMDGTEATLAIRALPPPRGRIPVLALTADVLPEHRERFLAAGVDDFVPKPIDWAVLAAALEAHVEPLVPAAAVPPPPVVAVLPPAASLLPGIDMTQALRRMDGDLALFWSLLGDFVADFSDEAERIQAELGRGDRVTARRRAHSLRGMAGNLGAARLAAAAGVIEKALKAEAVDGLEGAFAELRRSLAELVQGARGKGPAAPPPTL